MIGDRRVAIIEEAADDTPFGTLLHFRKDSGAVQPRVLLVAPMSGHFATLLRGTVQVMLPDHDVYITDWKNARDVAARGPFRLRRVRRSPHPLSASDGTGQPCGRGLSTGGGRAGRRRGDGGGRRSGDAAQHDADGGPDRHAGNPTKVNELAKSRPIEWFERHLISTVPWRFQGAFRHVYPGSCSFRRS